jgi:hypothetical protein
VPWLCRYGTTHLIHNNANAEERTKQLRNVKVEESRIQELSRAQFENLSQPVQEKAKRVGIEQATFDFMISSKSHDRYYIFLVCKLHLFQLQTLLFLVNYPKHFLYHLVVAVMTLTSTHMGIV